MAPRSLLLAALLLTGVSFLLPAPAAKVALALASGLVLGGWYLPLPLTVPLASLHPLVAGAASSSLPPVPALAVTLLTLPRPRGWRRVWRALLGSAVASWLASSVPHLFAPWVYAGAYWVFLLWILERDGYAPTSVLREHRPILLSLLAFLPQSYLLGQAWGGEILGLPPALETLVALLPSVVLFLAWAKVLQVYSLLEGVLVALVRVLEARDPYTAYHSERVAQIAWDLGRRFRLSERDLEHLKRAALLHDIGKIGVPERVLLKQGPLTEEEYRTMQEHTRIGEEVLAPLEGHLGPVVEAVLHHHERWDGEGYPGGLVGPEIPLLARILAVADMYEALTSHRPYRKALTPEEALAVLRKEAGKKLDPLVVRALEELLQGKPFWAVKEEYIRTTHGG